MTDLGDMIADALHLAEDLFDEPVEKIPARMLDFLRLARSHWEEEQACFIGD